MKAAHKNQQQEAIPNQPEMLNLPEINNQEPEHVRVNTLYTLHSNFIGIDHRRKTGRMVGHEPGPENHF
jgi:hypothetical protein